MWAFDFADPNLSIDDMIEKGLNPAHQISQYELKKIEKKTALTGMIEKNIM